MLTYMLKQWSLLYRRGSCFHSMSDSKGTLLNSNRLFDIKHRIVGPCIAGFQLLHIYSNYITYLNMVVRVSMGTHDVVMCRARVLAMCVD